MGRQSSARKRPASTAELSDQENPKTKTRPSRLTRKSAVMNFFDDEAEEGDDSSDFEEVDDGHEEGELEEEGDDCDEPLESKGGDTSGAADNAPSGSNEQNVDDNVKAKGSTVGGTSDAMNDVNDTASGSGNKSDDSQTGVSAEKAQDGHAVDKGKDVPSENKEKALIQTDLNTHIQKQDTVTVSPEDEIPTRTSFTRSVLKRFKTMFEFSDPDEATFGVRMTPDELQWSSARVKSSSLVVPGDVTALRLWVIGDLNWNGLLPASTGAYPARAKLGVTPLRSGDLMKFRQIVQKYSKTKKDLEINNITSISAHCDMAVRTRGNDSAEAKPFPYIYDGREVFSPEKENMRVIAGNTLVRGDVVLMEVTVCRYWDDSENGRVKDWESTRVYFHLEAVTLLVNAEEAAVIVVAPPLKPKKKIVL